MSDRHRWTHGFEPLHTQGDMTTADRLWSIHWPLIFCTAMIAAIGAAMLFSIAGGSTTPWAERHIVRLLIGLTLICLITAVPMRVWMALAYPAYAFGLGLLVLVALIGVEKGGAQRWLPLGALTFQPSEVMKIVLVLALARYFQWVPFDRLSRPLYVIIPLAMIAIPVALILKQPDLGTSTLLAGAGVAILFLAGVSWFYFVGGAVALAGLLPLIWANLHDYQKQRVFTFLEPERDPLGQGYQIFQSQIALGAGGVSGRGFMNGTQSQLDFLPEKHTDFIFTTFAEEMGFVGSVVLLALYSGLFLLLFIMAMRCASHFARLMAAGAAVMVALHTFVNMAMVTGLIPVVGAPLPLVSYGGTSMIATMIALGFASNAYAHRRVRIARRDMRALW